MKYRQAITKTAWCRSLHLLLLIFGLACSLTAREAGAKAYEHPLIEQTIRLFPNGDAEVLDVRTFRFAGAFHRAYLRLKPHGQYGNYDIRYLGVTDADSGQALRYETAAEAGERVLTWYYDAQNTTRRFALRYRIRNAVQRYEDVAQFYWKAIEDKHAPIHQVRLTVLPPAASPALFKVFIHSLATPGTLKIADDFRQAVVTQADIPESSFVELRVLLDPALFSESPRLTGETHKSLLEDERRVVNPAPVPEPSMTDGYHPMYGSYQTYLPELSKDQANTRVVLWLEGGVVLVQFAALFWLYWRYGREPDVPDAVEYEHEPPGSLPPAVVTTILTQGGPKTSHLGRALVATLLEGARLGYLTIREYEDDGIWHTGWCCKTDLEFTVTPQVTKQTGRGGDGGSVRHHRRAPEEKERSHTDKGKKRELTSLETEALEQVFQGAGDGSKVTGRQLRAWFTSNPQAGKYIRSWGTCLRDSFESEHFPLDDRNSAGKRWVGVFIACLSPLPLLLLMNMDLRILGAGMAVVLSLILINIVWKTFQRRTPLAASEYQRWKAFRHFLTDFSAMRSAGPSILPLWEHYLPYAAALGVTEKMLHNLNLLAQEQEMPLSLPTWYTPRFDQVFDGFEALSRTLGGMSNNMYAAVPQTPASPAMRALSVATTIGGFFSQGGGGGGGGGSSGAD